MMNAHTPSVYAHKRSTCRPEKVPNEMEDFLELPVDYFRHVVGALCDGESVEFCSTVS